MRIGLVLDQFDPRRGGVEQWTDQFARGLIRAGHQVHVVASGFGRTAESAGIVPHPFPPLASHLARAEAAEAVLRTLRLDVVHDMGVGWHCDVLQPHGGSRRAAFCQNLLLLPRWQRPGKRLLGRLLRRYREFDRLARRQYGPGGPLVLALSDMVRRDLERYDGVPAQRMRLVYNGVDVDRFSPAHRSRHREALRRKLGLRPEDVLFTIVAHNLKLKGVPALIRAMKRLTAPRRAATVPSGGPFLAVVGGKHLQPFRRMARRLGVAGRVHFVGAVDDAAPYYAASDVYVQPTFYDPCSLVVLEALACGLPVITSRFNGAGELITPAREGYLLDDPADADALAERMRSLLDAHRREHMGHAARELALRHSFQQNIRAILAVYAEVLSGRVPRARAA